MSDINTQLADAGLRARFPALRTCEQSFVRMLTVTVKSICTQSADETGLKIKDKVAVLAQCTVRSSAYHVCRLDSCPGSPSMGVISRGPTSW